MTTRIRPSRRTLINAAKWESEEHPRGPGGQFAAKPGGKKIDIEPVLVTGKKLAETAGRLAASEEEKREQQQLSDAELDELAAQGVPPDKERYYLVVAT